MKINKVVLLFIVFIISFCSSPLMAQEFKLNVDLSKIKVADLTDAQIRDFIKEADAAKLSNSRIEQVAVSRGMSPADVKTLLARIEKVRKDDIRTIGYNSNNVPIPVDSGALSRDSVRIAENILLGLKSKIFGIDLFKNNKSRFEPNNQMSVPRNYVLGTGDQLLIDVFGNSISTAQENINKDGNINVKYVGLINVAGLTLDAATSRIKQKLTSIYPDLATGGTKLNVTVGNIRSIKVIITGEVNKPGSYPVPSIASVFNALLEANGPTENGSFRSVHVIRGGKRIAEVDLYNFLISGELKNNVRLEDQDVIHVPYYLNRVEVSGEVKRPGIYELLPGENLNKLFYFAGDFTEMAYKARVKVLRNTDIERKIVDIYKEDFLKYNPQSGDKVFVEQILNRFANRVNISGAVFRPGDYELVPGLTLTKLIQNAEGLKEDAFKDRGYILRLQSNQEYQNVAFDLNAILTGKAPDIVLSREDKITISSIFDLRENYTIRVEGEVQFPGQFNYGEGISVEDAILMAGGFKESATPNRVEVSRRVKNSNALSKDAILSEVFNVDVDPSLKTNPNSFILQPFDIVSIRPSAGYSKQKQVEIKGEVLYPGIYTLENKNERISDLVRRAGGFTAIAYPEGGSLKRPSKEVEADVTKKIKVNVGDESEVEASASKINDYVGIDMLNIINKPGSAGDIFLEEGDIVEIPKQLQTVRVAGEVLSPVTVLFEPRKSFKEYISGAGGVTEFSKLKSGYVKYANGSVKSTKRFLFFKNYPEIKPGAEIYIPKGTPPKPISIPEIVGITSSLLTLILLFNQVSK